MKFGNKNIRYFQALVIRIIATIRWGPHARAPQGTPKIPALKSCSYLRKQEALFLLTGKEMGKRD